MYIQVIYLKNYHLFSIINPHTRHSPTRSDVCAVRHAPAARRERHRSLSSRGDKVQGHYPRPGRRDHPTEGEAGGGAEGGGGDAQ